MTSLAALFDWLAAGTPDGRGSARDRSATDYRLRSLPKEDIVIFVKTIDNSNVSRLVDATDWRRTVGVAGCVLLVSVMLIASVMPGSISLLASRQIGQLNVEREMLVNELRRVRAREAELLTPSQLDQWAGKEYRNPAASAVIFAPPAAGSVASIQKR